MIFLIFIFLKQLHNKILPSPITAIPYSPNYSTSFSWPNSKFQLSLIVHPLNYKVIFEKYSDNF